MYTTKQEVDEELPQEDELVEESEAEKILEQRQKEENFLDYLRQIKSTTEPQQQNAEVDMEAPPQLNAIDYYNQANQILSMQQGGYTENEQAFLEAYKKYQQGGVITDNRGQWAHPGKVTRINSPNITMQDVNYPVLGISEQTGEQKLMLPNINYFFNNTKSVIEYPINNGQK